NIATSASSATAIRPPLPATEVPLLPAPSPLLRPPPQTASLPFPIATIPLPSLLPTASTSPTEERTVVHRGDLARNSHTANNSGFSATPDNLPVSLDLLPANSLAPSWQAPDTMDELPTHSRGVPKRIVRTPA
ncbi:hypothetical protein B296_00058899, partial [Ensete ventricosum]